jgi:hypothetical protein
MNQGIYFGECMVYFGQRGLLLPGVLDDIDDDKLTLIIGDDEGIFGFFGIDRCFCMDDGVCI